MSKSIREVLSFVVYVIVLAIGALFAIAAPTLLKSCDVVPSDPLRARGERVPAPVEDFAVVTWTAPTTNADGSTLDDLAGYRLYHLPPSGAEVSIDVGLVLEYRLEELGAGVHAFSVTAYDTSGNESRRSESVSKAIP